eukprot:1375302-Prymnesium_polylepis.3
MTFQLAAGPLASRQRSLGRSALQRAKAALVRVEVVGITEDMAGFERVLAARWPSVFGCVAGGVRSTSCPIPSGASVVNPSSKHQTRGVAPSTLDDGTRAAIRSLNELDGSLCTPAIPTRIANDRNTHAAQAAAHMCVARPRCLQNLFARFIFLLADELASRVARLQQLCIVAEGGGAGGAGAHYGAPGAPASKEPATPTKAHASMRECLEDARAQSRTAG